MTDRPRRDDGPTIRDVTTGPTPAPPDAASGTVRRDAVASTLALAAGAALVAAALTPVVTVRGTLRTGGPPQSELGLHRTETVRAVAVHRTQSIGSVVTAWPWAAVALAVGVVAALAAVALVRPPRWPRRARPTPSVVAIAAVAITVLTAVAVLATAIGYRHERLLRPRAVRLGTVFVDAAVLGPAVWLCVAAAVLAVAAGAGMLMRGGNRAVIGRLAGSRLTRRIDRRPT